MFSFCYNQALISEGARVSDIDRIIEELLGDRRIREGAAFSSRTFSDQPLIERGSDFKKRVTTQAEAQAAREARREERERRIAARENARAARRRQQEFIRQQERKEARRQEQQATEADASPAAAPSSSQGNPLTEFVNRLANAAFDPMDMLGLVNPPRTTQPRMGRLPERIREMRKLEQGGVPSRLAYGSNVSAAIFYRQAKLMEDYEDDYEFDGTFVQYYPTYAAMSNQQLRGYFSWRTKVRAGNITKAPLSFAYVYLYELLCGIGTTPGAQGLEDLRSFGIAWHDANPDGESVSRYLNQWMRDYAIYHGLEQHESHAYDLSRHAYVLLCAEHAQLARDGRSPRIPNAHAQAGTPSSEQVLRALGETATYHLNESRLAKAEPELMALVASDVFSALVTHCSRRRKTDFVEGLFGYAANLPYTMFSAAIFYEEVPHPDTTVSIDNFEEFTCKNGRWRQYLPISVPYRSKELGLYMHEVDYELRRQLDYAYPLKQKKVPKYVEKIVRDAVAARLEERAEAERRRITIDRSKLRGIRAAAAVTQEALLTDEERVEELVTAPQAEPLETLGPPAEAATPAEPVAAQQPAREDESPAGPAAPAVPDGPSDGPLSPLEERLLCGLMDETPVSELLGPGDPFVSVVVDSINEKLFDLIGDTVVEFDGDEPRIIDDYLEDIREVLYP